MTETEIEEDSQEDMELNVLGSLRKLVIFKVWLDVVLLVLVIGMFIVVEQQHNNIADNTHNVHVLGSTVNRIDKSVSRLSEIANDITTVSPEEAARNAAITRVVMQTIPQIRAILCQVYPEQCQRTER